MSTERRRPNDDEFVMPSLRLDGRVALVTGGNRGLGLGVALALANAGADLALCARTREELEQAAELVRGVGRKAFTVVADLMDSDNVRDAVRDTADHYGRLDILVNGAGVNIRQPADTFTDADWDRVMTVNLKSAFFASQ
ncbi:MAG: SDR family NAD(P)-dependent oxidoreductase, partial [Solirubrobacterales bacterium]